MLLIYSSKLTNRVKYIFELLFSHAIKADYKLTDNKNEYSTYEGPKLNYSNRPVTENEVYIYAHSILFDTGIVYYHEEFSGTGEEAVAFKNKSKADVNFDIVAASFLLVSRYEEYLPHRTDRHKRYKAEQSYACKNQFLEIPLVNKWAVKLAELVKAKFPEFKYSLHNYRFKATFDIDNAYAYKNKGFIRTATGLSNAFLSFNFGKLKDRLDVLRGLKKDPYETYDILSDWQNRYSLDTIYFFLLGDYGKHDKNIPHKNKEFQQLIKQISGKSEIGLHPSFVSNSKPQKISIEKERIETIIGKDINKSRQHYIMLKFPETYKNLLDKGIKEDYSMGYATHVGFRASICTPFYFYDIMTEKQTNLLVHPFMVMDTTLKYYMKLSPDDAISKIKPLIQEVKNMGGEFVSIMHNESVSGNNGWRKWDKVLEEVLREAQPATP